MAEDIENNTLDDTIIKKAIDETFKTKHLKNKKSFCTDVEKKLDGYGFKDITIGKKQAIGREIDLKLFNSAFDKIEEILEDMGTIVNREDYDGIIVKKLGDHNVSNKNKSDKGKKSVNAEGGSGQSDVRPIKKQWTMFPHITRYDDYEDDPNFNNSLLSYYLLKIPVTLKLSNLFYLQEGKPIQRNDRLISTHTTVLTNNSSMRLSSQNTLNGNAFNNFRKLLNGEDYLIFLKKRNIEKQNQGQFLFEAYGVKTKTEDKLDDLDNCFIYLNTITVISQELFEKVEIYDDSQRCDKGKNILYYGVPGAGKSFTIQKNYCSDEFFIERVVFHPDYTYSDFVGQILPKVSDNDVDYKFVPGPFTSILKKANKYPSEMFYLIIEEINRGNAPAIFGDIFQLLDRKKQKQGGINKGTSEFGITNYEIAKEVYNYEEHKVRIPSNLSIIATMNTSDQNVFTLDTAFKRRWHMKMIKNDFNEPSFKDKCVPKSQIKWKVFGTAINEIILENANSTLSSEDKRLGAFFVDEEDLDSPKQFAEKVLMYLWDDVFKFSRDEYFDRKSVTEFSLESFIKEFENNQETDSFTIFTPIINNKIQEVKQKFVDGKYGSIIKKKTQEQEKLQKAVEEVEEKHSDGK